MTVQAFLNEEYIRFSGLFVHLRLGRSIVRDFCSSMNIICIINKIREHTPHLYYRDLRPNAQRKRRSDLACCIVLPAKS
jgi:hypothetical protein